MTDTINNGIPLVPENTIDPATGLNEAIKIIDRLLQLKVLAMKQNTPAASPVVGNRYIVGTSPTGAWAGHPLEVAEWVEGGFWEFSKASATVFGTSIYLNTGSDWVPASAGGGAAWGGITGTIGDQTDLQNALALREYVLTAGSNITIDRTNPAAPVISATGGGGGGSADWGDIGGDIEDQADLQAALDEKEFALVAGTNITINRSSPKAPVINALGGDIVSQLVSSEASISSSSTLTNSAFGKMHACSGTSSNYTVTLPPASGNAGKFIGFRIKSDCTVLVTILSSDLIDGKSQRILWKNESAILFCDGATWAKIAGKSIPMSCEMHPLNAVTVASAVNTKVPLETVILDTSGRMASLTNKRIDIPRSGLWRIQGVSYFQPGTAEMTVNHCRVHVNGILTSLGANIFTLHVPPANAFFNQHSLVGSLEALDYVELYSYQLSASSAARSLYVNSPAFSFLSVTEQVSW